VGALDFPSAFGAPALRFPAVSVALHAPSSAATAASPSTHGMKTLLLIITSPKN
jgi:hypothetical protein